MNERGLLGTHASLTADLSLVLGVLVALTLTVGVVMARRRKYHVHRWIQSSAVALNVVQVGVVMIGSFFRSAVPGVPDRLGDSYYAVAVGHGVLGTITLLFGVFVALRANELVPGFLRFHNYKLFMRSAYGLYMAATLAGVAVYLTWYTGEPTRPVAAVERTVAAGAGADDVLIPMAGFAFPAEVTVPAGATVVWVNQDGAPHTATADDGKAFGSDLLRTGQRFSVVVATIGAFDYYCELHGSPGGVGMAGKLTVVPRDTSSQVATAPVAPPVAGGAVVATTQLVTAAPTPAVAAGQPVAVAPGPTVPAGRLVAGATGSGAAESAIRQLLVDGPGLPLTQGYAVGLRTQADELVRQTRLLVVAESTGDLAGVRRKAEHVFNLIAGAADADFGDLDRDGRAQNAGDGFGLLANGDQPGYIRAVRVAAEAAARADDATTSVKVHAAHVMVCTDNLQTWTTEARRLALELTRVSDLRAVERPAGRLVTLAKWIALGDDVNGDGEVAPVPGEGGGLVAFEHAQFMAGSVSGQSIKSMVRENT